MPGGSRICEPVRLLAATNPLRRGIKEQLERSVYEDHEA